MAIGRTGEPLKSQLVPQGIRNRVTSLLETSDVFLEGLEQHSTGVQLRRSSVQASLLREGCASCQDRVPQIRRCGVRPWVEPTPGRNASRELLRHHRTSQPGGKSPRLEAPPARCHLQPTHRGESGRRTTEMRAERRRRTGVGWNQPDREVSIRILLYRLWWVDGPAPWPTSRGTTVSALSIVGLIVLVAAPADMRLVASKGTR